MSGTLFRKVSPARLQQAIAEVDLLLARSAKHYPQALTPFHRDRLGGIEPPSLNEEILAVPAWSECTDTPGASYSRTTRRLRTTARDQARALLVSESLGEAIVSAAERERLIARALDILPVDEESLFGELLSQPELTPRALNHSANDLLAAGDAIASQYGQATSLAWGMLVAGGTSAPEQMLDNARKLDRLFLRITSAPSVIQALDRAVRFVDERGDAHADVGSESSFQVLFGILVAVRDQLWALKPNRTSTPFLLPQVLDCYLGKEAGVGNSLGLGLVDAIILGKLGFVVDFLTEGDTIHLDITIENRGVFWEVIRPTPLSFIPIAGARRLKLAEVFALAAGSLAAVHFHRGHADRAILLYGRVLAFTPGSAEAHNNLGNCHLRQREPERAIEQFQRAIELRPEYPEAHYCLGNAWSMLERWPRAIDAYKHAIALRADYVEVYNNLGFAFQHAGAPEQAVAAYEAAIEIRPDYVQAHFNLGNIELELQHYDEAIRHYREAARLQPNLAQAWYNMGQAHYGRHQLDQAVNCYRRAIEVNPKHFGAWHNLGIVYRDKGMKAKAVEALEQAITLNPNLMR